jgi:hypothetical protein
LSTNPSPGNPKMSSSSCPPSNAGADILIPLKGRTDAFFWDGRMPYPPSVVRGTVTVATVTVDGLRFGPPIPSVTDDGWGVWATHTIRYG